jgi:hypothetical protein
MTPIEYIKKHVNIKISPSPINGVGVFALRDIEKDEILFKDWEGESGIYKITEEEILSIDENVREHIFDMFEYIKNENVWELNVILNKGCHWIFKTPFHWVNSCDWNENPNADKNTLKCLRKINIGEEITFKYGKYNKYHKTSII